MIAEQLWRVAGRIPGLRPLVQALRARAASRLSRDGAFHSIYERNAWNGAQSVSGSGSDDVQTRRLRDQLPLLWRRYDVRHLIDAPCGDFHWMRDVTGDLERYTGIDIVEPLVRRNLENFGDARTRFFRLDLVSDALPRADMILCRDCLVHLPLRDVLAAIANMKRSGSIYLLTTTFPNRERNHDIQVGDWRPLNLTRPPFNFPPPLDLLNEGCTEGGGADADKSLGLWRLADLPSSAGIPQPGALHAAS